MTLLNDRSRKTVGVRELRQNSSAVLRDVTRFGPHVVTVQGKPVATLSPFHPVQPITVEQFDALVAATPAEDARIYELIFGALVVSPSPDFFHQRAGMLLALAIDQVASQSGLAAVTDWSWHIDEHSKPRPDILVCAPPVGSATHLTGTPALVVEITSTNRADDLAVKRALYAQAGVPDYWVIDRSAAGGPALLAHTLGPMGEYDDPRTFGDPDGFDVSTVFGDVHVELGRILPQR